MKTRTTAAILAIFLGGLGVHRFYLNQTGLGFVYLLFCWTFIPAIVAFVDFICFLSMTDEQFNAKYNSKVFITSVSHVQNVSNVPIGNSDEIKRLYELKEKGIISNEEYELKKKTLL